MDISVTVTVILNKFTKTRRLTALFFQLLLKLKLFYIIQLLLQLQLTERTAARSTRPARVALATCRYYVVVDIRSLHRTQVVVHRRTDGPAVWCRTCQLTCSLPVRPVITRTYVPAQVLMHRSPLIRVVANDTQSVSVHDNGQAAAGDYVAFRRPRRCPAKHLFWPTRTQADLLTWNAAAATVHIHARVSTATNGLFWRESTTHWLSKV